MPHRRSAWIRYAERLDELSAFAADLDPVGGKDVLDGVSGKLSQMVSELMAHVEDV